MQTNAAMSDDSATIEDLVRAAVWTPEQQVRELKRRSLPPIAEGSIFFIPRPTDVILTVAPYERRRARLRGPA